MVKMFTNKANEIDDTFKFRLNRIVEIKNDFIKQIHKGEIMSKQSW